VLVVVTGNPGVGKTTLARELGERLRFPVLCKDDIKERLADVLGWTDLASSQRLGHATIVLLYDLVARILAGGSSVVAECNFRSEFASAPLRQAVDAAGARAVQVLLSCSPELAAERYAARARHGVHVITEIPPLPPLAPVDLPGALIELDTTTFPVDVEPVLAAVNPG
jgi:predicted kinase